MNNYQKRREKLLKKLPNDSMTILFSGSPVRKSADGEYPFESNRNFYYLTGIEEPEAILVLLKTDELNTSYLFIREIDEMMEKWVGIYIRPHQAREISGIEQVNFLSNFEGFVARQLHFNGIETMLLDSDRLSFEAIKSPAEQFAKKIKDLYPLLKLKNVSKKIAKLRLVKDESEIEKIKAAIKITDKGLRRMLSQMKPNQYEYQYLAEVLYEFNKAGASEMFDSICASGPNGVILHYVSNDRLSEANELCLFDLGAKKDGYGADISRTYPVSGKFSERQKQLYDIVLGAMEEVKQAAKPGVTLAQLNQIVIDYYAEKLEAIGLIKNKSEVTKYYYHSVSHFLGLDTHDVGGVMGLKLEAGHVITNEPGLYIAEENIGIRIENDLLITENGCIDLCEDVIKTTDEIEALMNA